MTSKQSPLLRVRSAGISQLRQRDIGCSQFRGEFIPLSAERGDLGIDRSERAWRLVTDDIMRACSITSSSGVTPS